MPFPFEVEFSEVEKDLDTYVNAVFGCLTSDFLVMPKGDGFVEFPVFEDGYEALKRGTANFENFTPDVVAPLVFERPIAFIVLRCMLGFTPPEWAYYATRHTDVEIPQGAARSIDRGIRKDPYKHLPGEGSVTARRIRALVEAACDALEQGADEGAPNWLNRLEKADTKQGLVSIRSAATMGIPYSMVLYERLLGRAVRWTSRFGKRADWEYYRECHRRRTVKGGDQLPQD